MMLRTIINCGWLAAALVAVQPLVAQEHPAKRLSSIVGVAVEEYGKAVDSRRRLVSQAEYQETVDFLADARLVAARLSGDRAAHVRQALDSIIAAVNARREPAAVAELGARFLGALGADGALEMPRRAPDVAAGRELFARDCASCHGLAGRGNGVGARGMDPAPPAIGTVAAMHDISPALAYRVISVGVNGTSMPAFAGRFTVDDRWNIVAYLTSLRSTAAQVAEGEGLFVQGCATCHGALGAGDGAASNALSKLPPEIASLSWQAEHSDARLAEVVRRGIPGTAMPPSRALSDSEVRSVVAYVRTLPARIGIAPVATGGADSLGAPAAARRVMVLLDDALGAARGGRASEAGDKAFDAYLAFEPIESPARAKSPGLVASMERHFADFKGAVRANDLRAAERARDAIQTGLPTVVELTRPTQAGWGAFLQSLLIIVREGFEAILVVGAVVAFLLKTGNRDRLSSIWVGVGLGLLASAVTAVILKTLLAAMPASREIIEGATMLIAVAVLFSVSYWLISKVEAAKWQQFIREKVSAALAQGGSKALAFVAFLAVYREGAETALFYQALFNEGPHLMVPLLLGIVAGFAFLAVIFTGFYRFGVRIPLRPFFAVTSVLLYYMAFVFAGKGIRELQEGNAMPITVVPGFPHVDALGLFPTVETLLAQLVLIALFVFALFKTFWPKRVVSLPTVPPQAPAALDLAARVADLQETNTRLQARVAALEDALSTESAKRGRRGRSDVIR
jgi:high-affinity iron transporter